MNRYLIILTNLALGTATFAMETPQYMSIPQGSSMEAETLKKEAARKTLEEQVPHVEEFLVNIEHPRLILGVGNKEELNSGNSPFLFNPSDVLVDFRQDPNILKNRTLSLNFNNLDELDQLSQAFPDTFDVITADFLVTKAAATWTKKHLEYLKKMLKPGGVLVLPIDQQASALSTSKGKTKQELFKLAAVEMNLGGDKLQISNNGVSFAFLPEDISATITVTPEEIDQQVELYKNLEPDYDYSPIVGDRQATSAKRQKLAGLADKLGIIGAIQNLPEDIQSGQKKLLEDLEKLKNYIRGALLRNKQDPEKNKLKDEFMMDYIIPLNLKRITAEVFDPDKIIIDRNLPLPQPHREMIYSGYAIAATK